MPGTVARSFRLWGKKRGDRRTGSRLIGSLGEAIFFGVLFLLGILALTVVATSQIIHPTPEVYQVGFGFWLLILVLGSFVVIGSGGLVFTVLHVGASIGVGEAGIRNRVDSGCPARSQRLSGDSLGRQPDEQPWSDFSVSLAGGALDALESIRRYGAGGVDDRFHHRAGGHLRF